MDNLEANLKRIQDQIDDLNEKLTGAQNQKLTAEVHLENERQEYEAVKKQLQDLTGLTDIDSIKNYMSSKETELMQIVNDVNSISHSVNEGYTFTEQDVINIKGIIDKYNIPVIGE